MASYHDLFAGTGRRSAGSSPIGRGITNSRSGSSSQYAPTGSGETGLGYTPTIESDIDLRWMGGPQTLESNITRGAYYDYFYSGQDVFAYIEGSIPNFTYNRAPESMISEIGWNKKQEKTPLYGFWSHTYDAVMRGNRLVTGAMTIPFTYVNFIKDKLTYAATTRARNQNEYKGKYSRPLTEDDALIEQYWSKKLDPTILEKGKEVFLVHPPFNIIVIYGVQTVNTETVTSGDFDEQWGGYQRDHLLALDSNDRLVDSLWTGESTGGKIVIEAVELVDVSQNVSPDGTPISETYTFFARDTYDLR